MSMGLLVDMPGMTRLPSRQSRAKTPQGKHGRSLRRPANPVMSCPVWSSLFAADGSLSVDYNPSPAQSSRPGSRPGKPSRRSMSMSQLSARPSTSQSISLGSPYFDGRPGTCQSSCFSNVDARPGTGNPTSLQMSTEEIEAMGSVWNDGLWWEWQKRGAKGWERCGGDASAELEEAYVLGEPSCRGFDLNALRSSDAKDIRRVRWPPRPETFVPPSLREPTCQLVRGGKAGPLDEHLDFSSPEKARSTSMQASVKGYAPQLRQTDGLSASSLVWPPVWANSKSPTFRPEAVGRASTAAAGQRQPSTRETSVSTYIEQDGSKSTFLVQGRTSKAPS